MNDCSRELSGEKFRGVVQIDESAIRSELGELVRGSVEETLNGLLEAEADELCGAKRYARSPDRVDTRAGHYQRKLQTRCKRRSKSVARDGTCVTVENRGALDLTRDGVSEACSGITATSPPPPRGSRECTPTWNYGVKCVAWC